MDPIARHERMTDLFHRAVDLPEDERDGFLSGACSDDVPLRDEVRVLLRADRDQSLAVGAVLGAVASGVHQTEPPGTRIGPYRLVKQIGEGGFGAVYLAEQDAPVARQVALKVIKRGMDTRQVIARFEAERQALALMDHPGIARVLDAGSTAGGRPYFVMELVQGEPITEYCDRQRLSLNARLTLFTQTCNAIQHAHQKGVIHRDVKPSNVLVTQVDGRPVAKVIDFGVAKALELPQNDVTLTASRHLIGTPQYMSPEQTQGRADIDTRSDIYSLGVLLYELLTGAPPLDWARLRQVGLLEFQRLVREQEPERPSTRVAAMRRGVSITSAARDAGGAPDGLAARPRSELISLGRSLAGDLDWIVLKCLEKDRGRRYESAGALARDIDNHLRHQPVLASPPSAAYRMRKFVRRNRGFVAGASLVSLSLLAGLVATLWFAWREAQAREEAERRQRDTQRIATFQAQMLKNLRASDAGSRLTHILTQRLADALTARETSEAEQAASMEAFREALRAANATDAAVTLLDHMILTPSAEAMAKQFADRPTIQATLLQTLADVHENLGRLKAAEAPQMEAIETRRRVLGEDHPDTIASINSAGALLVRMGRLDEASAYYDEAFEKSRRVLGEEHAETLRCLSNRAMLALRRGQAAAAEPILRQVLDAWRSARGDDNAETIKALNNYIFCLQHEGRNAEAEPLLQEALAVSTRVLGEEHSQTLILMNNLAMLLKTLGRLSEAELFAREGYEIALRVLGEEHPNTVAHLANYSIILADQQKLDEAEPFHRKAMELARRVLGNDHPNTIAFTFNLSDLCRKQGRLGEAERYLREVLERSTRVLGMDHSDTIWYLSDLTQLQLDQGLLEEANASATVALERARRALSDRDSTKSNCMHRMATVLRQQGNLAEAEALFREAVEGYLGSRGSENPQFAIARTNLGEVLLAQSRFREAEAELLQAQSVLANAQGVPAAKLQRCVEHLVCLYDNWGAAEPDENHEAAAADWRAKLAELNATTQPTVRSAP